MNRLERECLAASLVMHTLLLVAMVVGAGFASREKPSEEIALLTFVPDVLLDAPATGGGARPAEPAVQPPTQPSPPPSSPTPQPRIEPPPKPKPKPKPEPEKTIAEAPAPKRPVARPKPPDPESEPPTSPEGERPPPKPKIEPNLKPVTRPPDRRQAERDQAAQAEAARARAEAERLASIRQQRVDRIVTGLQDNLSGRTSVAVPGTGGATYASYSSYVDLVYRSAWAPLKPREAAGRSASVEVRVVVARDGTVLSSEIRRRSGNAALDRSVRAALDRVRTIGRPFPEGARDAQREFDITFTLESAGGAG